ncbi:hypothetical protein E2C01_058351 [Portunus trituberculatus]|uniref:Uncharacterized protein n=1 Tax=Portunus trituberculatus TaxID=210409 RepID=A0A5B7GW76_PORTR|nr:hypothetical protein [Portunus trituberculatus]
MHIPPAAPRRQKTGGDGEETRLPPPPYGPQGVLSAKGRVSLFYAVLMCVFCISSVSVAIERVIRKGAVGHRKEGRKEGKDDV